MLIAIFSRAVADSDNKCRFCKSSAMGASDDDVVVDKSDFFVVLSLEVG